MQSKIYFQTNLGNFESIEIVFAKFEFWSKIIGYELDTYTIGRLFSSSNKSNLESQDMSGPLFDQDLAVSLQVGLTIRGEKSALEKGYKRLRTIAMY